MENISDQSIMQIISNTLLPVEFQEYEYMMLSDKPCMMLYHYVAGLENKFLGRVGDFIFSIEYNYYRGIYTLLKCNKHGNIVNECTIATHGQLAKFCTALDIDYSYENINYNIKSIFKL